MYVYDEKRNPKTELRTEVYHASKRGFLLSGINGGQGDFKRSGFLRKEVMKF